MTEEPLRYTPVAAVSLEHRYAVLEDGRICGFTEMFDTNGALTTDTAAAVVAVAPHPDGVWLVLHLNEFDGATIH